ASAKTLTLAANYAATFAPINTQDLLQHFTLNMVVIFLWDTALNTLDKLFN
ncbi:hypothetical protein V8E53_013347, partial [Lactarius tabidus]